MENASPTAQKFDRKNHWFRFSLKGALFVAFATVIGINLQYPLTDETAIGWQGQISMSFMAFGIALVLSFFPAVSGFFLLKMVRRFQRRRFHAYAIGLGSMFGVTLVYVMPYGSLYWSKIAEGVTGQGALRILCFPLAPLIASVIFFGHIALTEIWIGKSKHAKAAPSDIAQAPQST